MKILVLIVFIFNSFYSVSALASSKDANKNSSESASQSEMTLMGTTGAVFGTFSGFGIGHIFQGRYLEKGWIMTTTQTLGVFVLVSGGFFADCVRNEDGSIKECGNRGQIALGAALFVGSRIYEIYDLWTHTESSLVLIPKSNNELAIQYSLNF